MTRGDPLKIALQIGDWGLDPDSGPLTKGTEVVRLEARTVRLLRYLAERPGAVVGIDELLDHVWPGVVVTPDSVYQAITSLRRQLGDDSKRPTYIATVPRLGYRMIAKVVSCATTDAADAGRAPESAAAPMSAAARTPHPRMSRVVLVEPRGPGKRAGVFADGLTEEIIGDLAKAPQLRVPSPTASFYFKDKNLPIADMAHQLQFDFVVDGSVRKAGGSYRVAARLVRADTGYVIWINSYDRPLGDLVSIQKSIAAEAAVAIGNAIDGAVQAAAASFIRET